MTTVQKIDGGKDADETADSNKDAASGKQLLHFVFGGELTALNRIEFSDLEKLDMVGIYPNYAKAYEAWKAAAQHSVDNAHMRYFIVHMHRLLDPSHDEEAC